MLVYRSGLHIEHEYRVLGAKEVAKHFVTFLNEGTELSLRLDINRNAKQMVLEFSAAGKPGSTVAAHIKDMAKSQSLFAGLASTDAALNVILHAAFPEPVRQLLGKVLDDAMHNVAKEKDATKRAHGEKIFKALAPTLKSGELDAAISLRGPDEHKLYTLVAGLKVKEGTTLDSVIRELSKDIPAEAQNVVKLDAEAEGDVKIHRFDIQHFFDADARKAFGDNPVYLALRADALFLSAGEGGLKAIKTAIAAGPASAPPLTIDVALARFVPLMGAHGKADPAAAARKAFGDSRGNGKLHFTVEGGNAFKVRLDLDAAAFQFLSLVGPK